jgi:hypothetical protein
MNILLTTKDLCIDNVQFLDTKDNIIMDGNFTKLVYADPLITMNGLYIYFPILLKSVHKNIAFFDVNENRTLLKEIFDIEKNILQYYKEIYDKTELEISSIKTQFMTGMIKLNSFTKLNTFSHENKCVIKISGIWENKNTIGITCKYIQC